MLSSEFRPPHHDHRPARVFLLYTFVVVAGNAFVCVTGRAAALVLAKSTPGSMDASTSQLLLLELIVLHVVVVATRKKTPDPHCCMVPL